METAGISNYIQFIPKPAIDILLENPTEVSARAVLRHAADYLFETGEGDAYRLSAMNLLEGIRLCRSNWYDLSAYHEVQP